MNSTTAQTAQKFAAKWLDAWNGHDIEAILSHYADDIVFLSPLAHQRVGNGQVIGIEALRYYWSIGLAQQPKLRFELERVLIGYGVVTICYRNHRGQSVAETFEFNESGKVKRAYARYS
jgi:hypothetical protein